MNRRELIKELFELKNEIKIMQYEMLLREIPTEQMINFANYTLSTKKETESKETNIARALREFHRDITVQAIKNGMFEFQNITDMKDFIFKSFINQRLCSCGKGSGFLDFVIISVDENGYLRNNYALNENGTHKRLDANEETKLFKWLFGNQKNIGQIKDITYTEYQIEQKKALEFAKQKDIEIEAIKNNQIKNTKINPKMINFLSVNRSK